MDAVAVTFLDIITMFKVGHATRSFMVDPMGIPIISKRLKNAIQSVDESDYE